MRRRSEASSLRDCIMRRYFLMPLTYGFLAGVEIPVWFFCSYIGEHSDVKTIILSSESTGTGWHVDLTGRKLTKGWKEFAQAHLLDEGDILIFKNTGHLIFTVTVYGPSRCKVQYVDGGEEEEPTSEGNRFVLLNVTTNTLKRSRIYLPKDFVTANGLEDFAGSTICLASESGVRLGVDLAMERGRKRNKIRLTDGLADFLKWHHIEANTTIRFDLRWANAKNAHRYPILQLCPKRKRQESGQSLDEFLLPNL